MRTQIIVTYENEPQQLFNVDLCNDLDDDLRNVADNINDTIICNDDIRKMSFCFLDIHNIDDMKKHKLTRSALETNGKYYFNIYGQLI